MRSRRRAGLVVGYLAGDEEQVAGAAAPAPTRTPRRRTIFEIGSITKVLPGAAGRPGAQGLVGLDDPLASYLPASAWVPTFEDQQLTLGDLSSRPGGLGRGPRACCGGGWVTGTAPRGPVDDV